MSLLLDALKKSEAQRRRGTSPTIDLTRTPPSGSPRRSGSRWLIVVLVGVVLVAAAPWLWPRVSDWFESRQGGADEAGARVDATNSLSSTADSGTGSGSEIQAMVTAEQSAPASVAGASSRRRVAAVDSSPASGTDSSANRPDNAADKISSGSASSPAAIAPKADDGAGPGEAPPEPKLGTAASDSKAGGSSQELRRIAKTRQQLQQAQTSEASDAPAKPARQVNEPTENFIRPWELPQAERAEFPELILTVHFYAERAADRFVLINGERYREGQRVGPGAKLVEIRQRGAVVEFGSYRVLIE